MRIVFFGTPELGLPCLTAVGARHEVTAVVCQPDRAKGRSKKLVAPPTKEWALAHGTAVAQPLALNDGAFEAWLREQAPDVCVLVAYGRILKQAILDVPRHGFLNMHPSLLPLHRGTSPIQTAIRVGDTVTGVSIMQLDAGMDTGDVLLQAPAEIAPGDTSASLAERLGELGASLMVDALELVESGSAIFTAQDDSLATVTGMLEKDDGRIRWGAMARDIHNLARASIPWPVAHCSFKGETWRIHGTEVVEEDTGAAPGTVVRVEGGRIVVAAGEGAVGIVSLQAPGKRAMAAGDFLRGHRIEPGDKFEDL